LNWAIDFGHLDVAGRILGATWLFMFLNPDGSGEWRRSAERVAAQSSAGTPTQSLALAAASCQALLDFDLDAVERHARGALDSSEDGSLAYFISSLALGTLLREQGSYEAAIEEHRKAEAIAQASNEAWFAARCLYSVALVELYRGNVHEARSDFSQVLATFEHLGDVESATSSLIYLHSIAAEVGDETELDASLGKIERLTPRGLPATIAASAPLRAEALFRRGDLYGALALALGGFDEATKMADPEVGVDCLEAIATALIRLGRRDAGVSLMAAAELISPLESRWWLPARWNRWREGTLLSARETLGTEAFSEAWARGKGTPVESLLLDV
jgi:tetratricopeptide (TPR) repeat protein